MGVTGDKSEVRESACGFHYIQTYQTCPRQWFIKYVLGILPARTASYLVLGKALHEVAAHYLETGSQPFPEVERWMIPCFEGLAEDLDPNTAPQELYTTLARMVRTAIPVWDADLQRYRVVAFEDELQPPLANGFRMTMRPDAVVEDRETGDVWIIERKNTQSSDTGMLRSVANGDQVVAYTLGLKRTCAERYGLDPSRVLGGIPEVSYVKGSVERTIIGDPIIPTQWQLDEYEARSIGLLSEIGNKLDLLNQGVSAEVLFGRAPTQCSGFLKCDYESICKRHLDRDSEFEGFRVDGAVGYDGPITDPKRYLEWVKAQGETND